MNCCGSVNTKYEDGFTPLRLAAANGHLEFVKVLMNQGAAVDITHQFSETPLSTAAKNGHEEVIQAMLNHGANINNLDNKGATPLHAAALKRQHGDCSRVPESQS
jgi:ankyrin repeat protein